MKTLIKTGDFPTLIVRIILMKFISFSLLFSFTMKAVAASSNEEAITSQEASTKKHYIRATAETLTILGLVSANYWATLQFEEDFDFDISLDTLGKKFNGEAIRFEDNDIINNSFPGHPLSGSIYYLLARDNNLSRLESFLWSLTSSYIFETFVEFSELLSINDMIVTPFAGSTIGESMYQMSRYLRCPGNRDRAVNKIMGVILDPVAFFNSLIWKDTGYKLSNAEEACNQENVQGDFSIYSGVSILHHEANKHFEARPLLGFHGKVYFIPHYAQEADRSEFLNQTVLSELTMELIMTNKSINKFSFGDIVESFSFYSKTIWAAYHRQHIVTDQAGNLTGYHVLIGLASAFDHVQYHTDEFEDWIGDVDIVGPALDITFLKNKSLIRFSLDIFPNFSMVRSFAFDEYRKNHSISGVKSVLRRRNYYYALGITINPKIEIRNDVYQFIAEYKYSYYDSIEGADRRGHLTNDFNLIDQREEYSVTFARLINFFDTAFFKKYHLWVEAEAQRRVRTGFIADDRVTHDGRNTWFTMRLRIVPQSSATP